MFVRKLYYDLITGEVLSSHMRQGSVKMTTFVHDVAILPELAGRSEENTGCMVWTEPDAAIEESFSNATRIIVDVNVNPHQIIFNSEALGTIEDPIPWVSGMNCFADFYYTYNDKLYKVAAGGSMMPCTQAPDSGIWQWELIEE